ncbi:hypothetical protein ACVQ8P_08475 [Dellaglioa sp. BT-FLS60]
MRNNILIFIGFLLVLFLGILGFKTLIEVKDTQPVEWAEVLQIQPAGSLELTKKHKINAGTNGLPVQAKKVVGGAAILPHKSYYVPADWTVGKGSKNTANTRILFHLKKTNLGKSSVQINTADAYSGGVIPATVPVKVGVIQDALQKNRGTFKKTSTVRIGQNSWYLSVILEPKTNSIDYIYYRIEDTESVTDSTIVVDYSAKLRAAQRNPEMLKINLSRVEAVINTFSKTSVAS